jgi:hypothetical protein
MLHAAAGHKESQQHAALAFSPQIIQFVLPWQMAAAAAAASGS